MYRNFLEMKEILSEEDEMENGIQPIFHRVLVNGKADAIAKKPQFLGSFAGRPHRSTYHTCPHPKSKCTEEEI